jgi:very-short-patch-repair endonuclease
VGVIVANPNARALRKRLTPQEVKLWVKLRELKPLGFHFRWQAPVGRYIVDFVSFGDRVVVEIDGGQHGLPEGAQTRSATHSCAHKDSRFFAIGIPTSTRIWKA